MLAARRSRPAVACVCRRVGRHGRGPWPASYSPGVSLDNRAAAASGCVGRFREPARLAADGPAGFPLARSPATGCTACGASSPGRFGPRPRRARALAFVELRCAALRSRTPSRWRSWRPTSRRRRRSDVGGYGEFGPADDVRLAGRTADRRRPMSGRCASFLAEHRGDLRSPRRGGRRGVTADPEPDPSSPAPTPAFAHASEAEMARILDFYAVRWEYEPTCSRSCGTSRAPSSRASRPTSTCRTWTCTSS